MTQDKPVISKCQGKTSSSLTCPMSHKVTRCTGWVCVTFAEEHQVSAEKVELIARD